MEKKIPRHSIRFGKSSEKKTLENHQDTFESIVLNAPSLAYFGNSLSTFIFMTSKGKSFFIDPLTHGFQHSLDKISNEKGEIKPSIKKLIDYYGEPLLNVILNGGRPLKPGDFLDDRIKKNFAHKVLDFQRRHLFNCLEDDFKEYLEDDDFSPLFASTPLFLVPPYFYMTESNYEQWLPVNREFIEISKDMVGNSEKVFGELVVSKSLLRDIANDNGIFEEMAGIYNHADGILFWIDDFDEHNEAKDFLESVIKFVKKTKEKFPGKPIINLYGGYFSQLLQKFGLDGVVHGPEYGESRAVVPVGGGIPIAKYYYPEIRKRIPSPEVIWLLKSQNIDKPDDFFEKVCSCKICRTLIKSDVRRNFIEKYGKTKSAAVGKSIREYPVQETVENCLSHYLEVKKTEYDDIESKEMPELLNELEVSYEKFKREVLADEKEISHLKQWVDAFRNE